MLTWIREKFGTFIISTIIGLIAVVFIFFGVFSPKSTRGLHDGAVAGKVNGDSISLSEFNRAFNQRLEMFKSMGGDLKFSEEQIKAFRIREGVFQGLVRRKLLIQEARRQGLLPSDEEVRDRIREIPAFQKDGKFDLASYQQALEANQYTPSGFERLVRDDLAVQRWEDYFKSRVHVSDEEVRQQFLMNGNKRNIKYVVLSADAGRRGVAVSPKEIENYLKDPAKLNLAKSYFESRKETDFKGRSFEVAKDEVVRSLLSTSKLDEIRVANERMADKIVPLLGAGKANDAKINAMLKASKVEVKTSGWISESNPSIPGMGAGDSKDLLGEVFQKKSTLDPSEGGKAKKYVYGPRVIVAVVIDSQKPDMGKLETERSTVIRQVASRKEREIFESWIKQLSDKAKVEPNEAVVGSEAST